MRDTIGRACLRLSAAPVHAGRDGRLAFDLLSSYATGEKVIIGHANGVITIDVVESLDDYLESLRIRLGEPYRTMLGQIVDALKSFGVTQVDVASVTHVSDRAVRVRHRLGRVSVDLEVLDLTDATTRSLLGGRGRPCWAST